MATLRTECGAHDSRGVKKWAFIWITIWVTRPSVLSLFMGVFDCKRLMCPALWEVLSGSYKAEEMACEW